MANLIFSENCSLVALVCSSKFKILDYRDGTCKYSCELLNFKLPQATKSTTKSEDSGQDTALGHGNVCSFSPSGSLFGLCTSSKTLSVWRTDKWECIGRRLIEKKPTALLFTSDDKYVVISDKAGDVYKFCTKDYESKGALVLGHISMIMDMVITNDDKYIITADRDEKIRVSRFPNSYSIDSYCLGHTDFVSCIKVVTGSEFLVSGSGDSNIMFWDFKTGKKLHSERLCNDKESKEEENNRGEIDVVACIACCQRNRTVCAITEKSCNLHLYHLDDKGLVTTLPSLTTSVPPWHVTFDSSGLLWCLLPDREEPVVIYKQEKNNSLIKYIKIVSFEDLPIYNQIGDWSYLEGCVGKEKQLALLRKKTDVDNMKDYLTRKEERIQLKKVRQEELKAKETQNTSKRVKV